MNGDVHAVKVPPSTRHSKPVPPPVKLNVGVLLLVGEVIGVRVVSGVDVSMTKVCADGVGSVLPAVSIARTLKVCEPSASAAVVNGDTHAA